MIQRGGRRDVFLGTRECQAYVEPCVFGEGDGYYDDLQQLDFGVMVHGMTYADEAYSEETAGKMTVNLWRLVMKNGIIQFPRPEECPLHKEIKAMKMKVFGLEEQNFSFLCEQKGVT